MGRKALIDNDSLFEKISDAFRADGYEGASLSRLSEATGLKKASLYHRFPGGKEQMASEILDWDVGRLAEDVSADLVKPELLALPNQVFLDLPERCV